MFSSDTEDDHATSGLFEEPDGFYQPEKQPTTVTYQTLAGQQLSLRLVGHSPLWGHLLWNAGRILARYLETQSENLVRGRCVLELGAGAGLPSLICALKGAESVVVTDYPEPELIDNLRYNIEQNEALLSKPRHIAAEGYLWGAPIATLASHLSEFETASAGEHGRFDLLILGDLLFNHSEHDALVSTVHKTLRRSSRAQALVFFTPYRPWLLQNDLAFFDTVRNSGMIVEKILEEVMDSVMFAEDPGDEKLRRTVFGYRLKWPEGNL